LQYAGVYIIGALIILDDDDDDSFIRSLVHSEFQSSVIVRLFTAEVEQLNLQKMTDGQTANNY